MNPIESSANPDTSSTPKSIYTDSNITVYGIPINPLTEHKDIPSDPSESSQLGSKRKRDPSPDLPTKRPVLRTSNSFDVVTQLPSLTSGSPTDSSPAQDVRKTMIQAMFPDSKDVPAEPGPTPRKPSKKGKGSASDATKPMPGVSTNINNEPTRSTSDKVNTFQSIEDLNEPLFS